MPGEGDAAGDGEMAGDSGEPGFEDVPGDGAGLPSMSDGPSLEDSMGALEDAMGDGAMGGGTDPGESSYPAGSPYGIPGVPGRGDGVTSGEGQGSGGALTPAEQVAILDAQLERGTGEFDTMILEEQAEQRRAAREQAATASGGETAGSAPAGGSADAGGYSTGGGMPGAAIPGGGASDIPRNTAKYPPPGDIPSGNDDDVVARQLREAAMREPDPAVREKLWDEYRKYKGVSN